MAMRWSPSCSRAKRRTRSGDDQEDSEQEGRKEGEKIGVEKGEKIGIEKGEKIAKREIAKSLLDVLDIETISLKTGLSIEEIESLKEVV